MNKKILIPFLLAGCLFSLTGCGKDQSLETYKENMTVFCDNIIAQNEVINSIDPASETATEDLLNSLDTIEAEFTTLADMEVPEQFSAIESLADEAGAYMTEAVSLYHEAFGAEVYDDIKAQLAAQSYQRAIKRVQYIGDIMMGQLPDDENVEITYEDSTSDDTSDDTQAAE
ncbi:MAG: hypothetical protein PHT89_09355 [Lachnospiraceae bacterium]|nr:hypothetical protein [Lachnospiraceae bacterium]